MLNIPHLTLDGTEEGNVPCRSALDRELSPLFHSKIKSISLRCCPYHLISTSLHWNL